MDNAFLRRTHGVEASRSEVGSAPRSTNEDTCPEEILSPETKEPIGGEEKPELDVSLCLHEETVEESDPIVKRLLQKVPEQWLGFAKSIESEVQENRSVIAIVGGVPGEGCSTIARGLVSTLRCRGWNVTALEGAQVIDRQQIFGSNEEKRVAIVDAGAWFPPGPIQHDRITALSDGYDAVVLVRRASKAPSAARATVIKNVGLHLIGEVETFVNEEGIPSHGERAH